MPIKGRIKIKHNTRPTLDHKEFRQLYEVLIEATKENYSRCGKLLGVTRKTFMAWNTNPPKWPWWNMVLREAIKIMIASTAAKKGMTRKHRSRIIHLLSQIPKSDSFLMDIENMAYEFAGAEAHLRRLLAKRGMFKDEIMTVKNMGGYSSRSLESAARTLSVVKTQEGYGKDKRSYWRLPDQDDD